MADCQPITSVSELIYQHECRNPGSKFFSNDTLKFFGERRSDMYLYKTTEKITTPSGDVHICYRVRSKQRKAPGGPKTVYHFFDVNTLAEVIRG